MAQSIQGITLAGWPTLRHFSWLVSLTPLQASTWLPRMADWLKNGCRGCFVGACHPEACAHKTTNQSIRSIWKTFINWLPNTVVKLARKDPFDFSIYLTIYNHRDIKLAPNNLNYKNSLEWRVRVFPTKSNYLQKYQKLTQPPPTIEFHRLKRNRLQFPVELLRVYLRGPTPFFDQFWS